MNNYCAFSNNHKCPLWIDYELTCFELDDAKSLCHENWQEIQHKQSYIELLQKIISDNHLSYPDEYDF